MRAIELFTGAGGLALGTARAGFGHVALVEYNSAACNTLRHNRSLQHPLVIDSPVHQTDVRLFDYEKVGTVDLVAGGPPCQPFSIGGKHKGNLDQRDMFPEAVRAVHALRPRAFIFENVKGLLRESFSTYFEYIILQLSHPEIPKRPNEDWQSHQRRLERQHTKGTEDALRYNVVFNLVNACDYGVPQKRQRVIIVGFRSDLRIEWSFPKKTHSCEALAISKQEGAYWDFHKVPKKYREQNGQLGLALGATKDHGLLPWRTVRDAIHNLPPPSRDGSITIPSNHVFMAGARPYKGHTGSELDQPAKTLKAGDHGVPGGENTIRESDGTFRYFTIREAARLQTFPDDYVWNESWTESMRQIGNAVPVLLAETVAESIRKALAAAK